MGLWGACGVEEAGESGWLDGECSRIVIRKNLKNLELLTMAPVNVDIRRPVFILWL